MNSQLRGSKQKQYEESTQNTYEGSSISKQVINGNGQLSHCEALSDRILGMMICEDKGEFQMQNSNHGKKVSELGGKKHNAWETPEKSQGQWSADGQGTIKKRENKGVFNTPPKRVTLPSMNDLEKGERMLRDAKRGSNRFDSEMAARIHWYEMVREKK